MPTNSVVFKAAWKEIPKYTVTYKVDGSVPAPTQEALKAGETFIVSGYDGVKEGYVFEGWNDGTNNVAAGATYTMPEANVVLTAVWEEDVPKYTVTYDVAGGSLSAPTETAKKAGETFVVSGYDGVKEGFTFNGWNDGTNNVAAGATYTMPEANVVFTAVWQPLIPVYTVTYDVNGGDAPAPTQDALESGEKFKVAEYTGAKEGYKFNGWNDGSKVYRAGTTYTISDKDVVFTAEWRKSGSSSSGGSGGGSSIGTATIVGTADVPDVKPTEPAQPTEKPSEPANPPVTTEPTKPPETKAPEKKKDGFLGLPGFELIGAIAGIGAAALLMRRRK